MCWVICCSPCWLIVNSRAEALQFLFPQCPGLGSVWLVPLAEWQIESFSWDCPSPRLPTQNSGWESWDHQLPLSDFASCCFSQGLGFLLWKVKRGQKGPCLKYLVESWPHQWPWGPVADNNVFCLPSGENHFHSSLPVFWTFAPSSSIIRLKFKRKEFLLSPRQEQKGDEGSCPFSSASIYSSCHSSPVTDVG